ncbi:MAG: aminotransferase class V-fold PLP-dependent enzyme [Candidatus Fimisoma sp.]|nr:aminotransferase class V-fold PLP-dependent enzyme [Candidatus Fimisoma sp.]
MIYFDNAATSKTKPESVYDAFMYYVREIGTSPGRGSYTLGVQASRMLYESRKTVNRFFGNSSKTNVVFTKNSTEAINLFINSFVKNGDHVLISCFEHNAVLRPIHTLMEEGIITYTVLPESVFENPEKELGKYIQDNTRLAAITLASNLTGQVVYSALFGKICKDHNISVFVDASQGGGKNLVNMVRDNIEYLAFTGHKDLYALPGVGGLCSRDALQGKPLLQGGTGIHGEEFSNPRIYPEGYESGTLNMPAIWSLKTSLEFISQNSEIICEREDQLMNYLLSRLKRLNNITVYNADRRRVSTVCFNVKGVPSSEVVSYLDKHGVCVRGGIHCAILAHQTLGTVEKGAVRVSLNYMNTEEEIDDLIRILEEVR